jgi:acyl-CoA thioester hydrolase
MIDGTTKEHYDFCHSIRVRYSEVDMQGIVFNAHYLDYIDVAIGEYFRLKYGSYKEFVDRYSIDFHVVRSLLEYRYAARYDDMLDLCLRAEYRGAKVFWNIGIFSGETRICSGELVYLAVDTVNGGVTDIGREVADLLAIKEKTE